MALASRRSEPVTILQRELPLRPDLVLLMAYMAVSALGIVMVWTVATARLEDPTALVRRHTIFVVIGLAAFLAVSLVDLRSLRALAPLAYIISLGTLVAVLFAPLRAGTSRWIPIGTFQFQPSEFAKVAVILGLAALLASAAEGNLKWYHVARSFVLVGIPSILIFKQPDLGTMLVFGFIAVVVLFAAGTTWRQLVFLVLVAVFATVIIFQTALLDFQLERITAFLDPTEDLAATSLYNQRQSEIAIGSGGFFGAGLFEGTQTNLRFVPEQSTDFIFTAVGEQLGFVGGSIVIALYTVIVWRVMMAAAVGRDRFSQLTAVGIAALLVFHVFVNIGMTMRLMPVTGLPLPFLSAGGSAFLAMSIALGFAHSIWMRRSPVPGERG
jgi:rod shape determining protein RodA